MGEQFEFRRHLYYIMKYLVALLFLAALAIAEPESNPEATADPAADAWYGYYGYPGYYGHRYYGWGGYYGHRYGYGYWGRKKREADPAVLASSSALTAPQTVDLPVAPYAYGLHAPLLAHAVPHTYTVGPATVEHTPGTVEVKSVGTPLVYAGYHPYGHWGYGYGLPVLAAAPAAAEAVTEERKKRDADADPAADAWYGYYGYPGYYGYGYRYWGGYYGLGYRGYWGRYWKREAEAEPTAAANPEADASADAYYGYYGYPGYYGYGYRYGGYYARP